jgi:hypothetical protein
MQYVPLTELSDAVEASHQALAAIIQGDVEPFLALYSDAEDISIGNPFGPFAVGRDGTREAGTRAASNYSDGEIVAFDRVATHCVEDRLHAASHLRRTRAPAHQGTAAAGPPGARAVRSQGGPSCAARPGRSRGRP